MHEPQYKSRGTLPMNTRSLAVALSTAISIGALAFWYHTAPATGCGWAIVLAWFTASINYDTKHNSTIAILISIAFPLAAAFFWYFGNSLIYSGWVGLLAIIGTLQGIQKLYAAASAD